MKPKRFFLAAAAVAALALNFSLNVAHAYPVGSTGSMPLPQFPAGSSGSFNFSDTNLGSSFQTLITPFEEFFKSLQNSIGTQPVVGPTTPETNPSLPTAPNFNFSHESLSGFFVTILQGMLWVLGLTQQFIQWLISLIH